MLGDLASLPFLMNAPCPHFEQISTRESDAAVVATICPQLGQAKSGDLSRKFSTAV
jgi:hypothetical protein